MVELGQSLDMERKTREAVMGGGVQNQPRKRVVTLEDVSAKKKRVQSVDLSVCLFHESRHKVHVSSTLSWLSGSKNI